METQTLRTTECFELVVRVREYLKNLSLPPLQRVASCPIVDGNLYPIVLMVRTKLKLKRSLGYTDDLSASHEIYATVLERFILSLLPSVRRLHKYFVLHYLEQ